jgi:hypothetical protein
VILVGWIPLLQTLALNVTEVDVHLDDHGCINWYREQQAAGDTE